MSKFNQTCENCRFFEFVGHRSSLCKRYPPRAVGDVAIYCHFPVVDEDDRCGEWRPILENGNISAYDEEFTQG